MKNKRPIPKHLNDYASILLEKLDEIARLLKQILDKTKK